MHAVHSDLIPCMVPGALPGTTPKHRAWSNPQNQQEDLETKTWGGGLKIKCRLSIWGEGSTPNPHNVQLFIIMFNKLLEEHKRSTFHLEVKSKNFKNETFEQALQKNLVIHNISRKELRVKKNKCLKQYWFTMTGNLGTSGLRSMHNVHIEKLLYTDENAWLDSMPSPLTL